MKLANEIRNLPDTMRQTKTTCFQFKYITDISFSVQIFQQNFKNKNYFPLNICTNHSVRNLKNDSLNCSGNL